MSKNLVISISNVVHFDPYPFTFFKKKMKNLKYSDVFFHFRHALHGRVEVNWRTSDSKSQKRKKKKKKEKEKEVVVLTVNLCCFMLF
jgi:hypothetical protein